MNAIFSKSNVNANKWLIGIGSFLIVVGFFMPLTNVNMDFMGFINVEYSVTMRDIGRTIERVNLVLIGAFISIVLSFLSPKNDQQRFYFTLGKAGGLGLGFLIMVFDYIDPFDFSLGHNILTRIVEMRVGLGFYLLILGYILGGYGVAMEFFQSPKNSQIFRQQFMRQNDPPAFESPKYADAPAGFSSNNEPRLELISGNAPAVVSISSADFSIGRSRQNDFSSKDPQVSRIHARIRQSQGAWFIQDQNSTSGTFVNGRRIQAQRLNDGDQIRFGKITFRFHL